MGQFEQCTNVEKLTLYATNATRGPEAPLGKLWRINTVPKPTGVDVGLGHS